jgi:hypothetical protein
LRIRIPVAAFLLSASLLATSARAQDLAVHLDGDYLRVSLPNVDFLQGKPLSRLKDGGSVAFVGQLTISTAPNSLNPVARAVSRFALSYDIWAENFSVTKIGQAPESRRTISHLSAQAAESWCLDNLGIDRSQLPADKPFYVELDLRAEDPKDQLGLVGEPGINITRLIEMFAGPPRSAQPRWLKRSGPWRLDDLKKTEIRGARG